MALQFVEADQNDGHSLAKQDGAAEAITAGKIVKLIYDDTAETSALVAAAKLALENVLRLES